MTETGAGSSGSALTAQGSASTVPGDTRGHGGRGRGSRHGGRGGRGGPGRGNGASNRNIPVFKGNTEGMNGHVFQCQSEGASKQQFARTLEALAEYVAKHITYAKDVASLCKTGKLEPITEPADLPEGDKTSETKKMIWKATVESYVRRVETRESSLQEIHAVIWGQCSVTIQAKLRSLAGFDASDAAWDCEWLLLSIRGIMNSFEGTRYVFLSVDDARTRFYSHHQGPNESVHEYMLQFKSHVEVLEHYGATMGTEEIFLSAIAAEDTMPIDPSDTVAAATRAVRHQKAARDRYVAIAFLKRADRRRFGALWADLENQHSRGNNQHPPDLASAYSLLIDYKPTPGPGQPRYQGEIPSETSGMTFLQTGETIAGTDGVVFDHIKCFKCQKKGHFADKCPEPSTPGVSFLQTTASGESPTDIVPAQEFCFSQRDDRFHSIPSSWVLLDSESTVSVFNNKALLSNIRESDRVLRVSTNGGTQLSRFVGDIKNFGEVWYNPKSLANILAMAAVRKVCRITMDSSVEAAICVHKTDGSIMKFIECDAGLYYHDTAVAVTTSTPVTDYSFFTTVDGNKRLFTRRQVAQADAARRLYINLDRPSEADFEHRLRHNLLRNCPVTVEDAKRALMIYGPDPAILKGKSTKTNTPHIPNFVAQPIPDPILEHHGDVTICCDNFYLNGNPFFHTISRAIKFRTAAPIANRSKRTLLLETRTVTGVYTARQFTVTAIHADREFACLRHDLLPIHMNIAPADAHVPEVERSIRTIKERARSTIQGMPFRRIPKVLVNAVVERAIRGLNQFPARDGVSDTISPLTIMTGLPAPDYNLLQLEFGSYVQVFEANDPTNTMKTRATGAIVLNPDEAGGAGYTFMSLVTGRKLSRSKWTVLPMPEYVVARVEAMGLDEGQPLMVHGEPLFEWAPGAPVDDPNVPPLEDEGAGDEEGDDGPPYPAIDPAPVADVFEEDALLLPDEVVEPDPAEEEFLFQEPDPEVEEFSDDDAPTLPQAGDAGEVALEDEVVPETVFGVNEAQATSDDAEDLFPNDATKHAHRMGTRGNRISYDHRFATEMDNPESGKSYRGTQLFQKAVTELRATDGGLTGATKHAITGFLMTQMTAKAGIKKHGDAAIQAMFKEFAQLDDKDVFDAVMPETITPAQRSAALRAVNVIKEKRNGVLKGRTCADGSKQRNLFAKEETASPTVSADALLMSLIIDAKEKRDVATADVVGAYLHADMKDFTLLRLTGTDVDIMCRVNPKYIPFVTHEHGVRVLYLQLLKALYGCVQSTLLWYDLYVNVLQGLGFVLNPYDMCVANMMIDGKQCTILWYVDDNKISHVDEMVVSRIIEAIEHRFGKMVVTRGDHHIFLGVEIKFPGDGTVKTRMRDHLREAIDAFRGDITRSASTPARRDLFEVDTTSEALGTEEAESFHSIAAKLLHVTPRARPDLSLVVAFLCTRVSCSTLQDKGKLRRALEFVQGTIDDWFVLGADDLTLMRSWIDASFAVHEDMRSHTGGCLSFGRGSLMNKSSKQKLNTKSSTEAEVVGASDYLPNTIWMRMFLEAQGYVLQENIYYQDNQSAMKMEINGRRSAGQKSRHVDIRFFFIKDRIQSEGLSIRYCPTERMLGDYYTKPLQGGLFRKLRAVIMGHAHTDTLSSPLPPASQERVEYKGKDSVSRVAVKQDLKVTLYGSGAHSGSSRTSQNETSGCEKKVCASPCRKGYSYADVVRSSGTARATLPAALSQL